MIHSKWFTYFITWYAGKWPNPLMDPSATTLPNELIESVQPEKFGVSLSSISSSRTVLIQNFECEYKVRALSYLDDSIQLPCPS